MIFTTNKHTVMLQNSEMHFYTQNNPNIKLFSRWLLLFDLVSTEQLTPFSTIPENEVDKFSVFLYRKLYDLHKNNRYISIKEDITQITAFQAQLLDFYSILIEFLKNDLQKIRYVLNTNRPIYDPAEDKKDNLFNTYMYLVLKNKKLFYYFTLYVYFHEYVYDNSKHIENYYNYNGNYKPKPLTYDYITNKLETIFYSVLKDNLKIVKFRKKDEKYLPEALKTIENFKNLNFKYKIPDYTFMEYRSFDEKLERKQISQNNINRLHNEITKTIFDFFRNYINSFAESSRLRIIMTPNLIVNPYEENDDDFWDEE